MSQNTRGELASVQVRTRRGPHCVLHRFRVGDRACPPAIFQPIEPMPSRTDTTDRDPWNRLDRYRRNMTSQCGEDGIVEHLLELLPDTPKTCLEVGAGDGITLSNTNTLWSKKGWRALLIESEKLGVQKINERAAGNANVSVVQATIAPTGQNSIDEIAKRSNFPARIGVLSLDIDSNDIEVFETLHHVAPDIVIIEFNHEIPADIVYRDLPGDVFFRHSAKAVEACARARGYRVVACTGPNAFLVRGDLIAGEAAGRLPDLPIEALFDYSFLRARRSRYRLVESKFITEEIATFGKPDATLFVLVRILAALRKLRRLLRGKRSGERITAERRANLHRAGLWI